MRFYEIIAEDVGDDGLDKFVTVLKNFLGRSASKRQPAFVNWEAIAGIADNVNFEMLSDPNNGFETFKQLYDGDPKAKAKLEPVVKDFNERGITLNVPGVKEPGETPEPNSSDSPADAVAATAAGAVDQQISQNQQGVQI
jgi:hypothetical protein